MAEKKRSKRNALAILLIMTVIMAAGVCTLIMTLPEILAMPDHTGSDPVKINPEWENLSSYNVEIRPFPWIDVERETIENPISNELFLEKVETGKIARVRYVVKDYGVKLYGYQEEQGNYSSRWDLYSAELVPEQKLEGGVMFSDPRQTEKGIVFTETSPEITGEKLFLLLITVVTACMTIYLIHRMVVIYKDKEFETREEEE